MTYEINLSFQALLTLLNKFSDAWLQDLGSQKNSWSDVALASEKREFLT